MEEHGLHRVGLELFDDNEGEAALAVFLSAGNTPCERRGQEGGSSMRGLEILLHLRDRMG